MPKGGLHHLHTTAAPSADFYVKLTYNDFVYFNEREKLFKVVPVSRHSDKLIIFREEATTRTAILSALTCGSSRSHPRTTIVN